MGRETLQNIYIVGKFDSCEVCEISPHKLSHIIGWHDVAIISRMFRRDVQSSASVVCGGQRRFSPHSRHVPRSSKHFPFTTLLPSSGYGDDTASTGVSGGKNIILRAGSRSLDAAIIFYSVRSLSSLMGSL